MARIDNLRIVFEKGNLSIKARTTDSPHGNPGFDINQLDLALRVNREQLCASVIKADGSILPSIHAQRKRIAAMIKRNELNVAIRNAKKRSSGENCKSFSSSHSISTNVHASTLVRSQSSMWHRVFLLQAIGPSSLRLHA
jgi:hypothetical protein